MNTVQSSLVLVFVCATTAFAGDGAKDYTPRLKIGLAVDSITLEEESIFELHDELSGRFPKEEFGKTGLERYWVGEKVRINITTTHPGDNPRTRTRIGDIQGLDAKSWKDGVLIKVEDLRRKEVVYSGRVKDCVGKFYRRSAPEKDDGVLGFGELVRCEEPVELKGLIGQPEPDSVYRITVELSEGLLKRLEPKVECATAEVVIEYRLPRSEREESLRLVHLGMRKVRASSEEAIVLFRRALDKDKKMKSAIAGLVYAYSEMGKLQEAKTACQKLTAEKGKVPRVCGELLRK